MTRFINVLFVPSTIVGTGCEAVGQFCTFNPDAEICVGVEIPGETPAASAVAVYIDWQPYGAPVDAEVSCHFDSDHGDMSAVARWDGGYGFAFSADVPSHFDADCVGTVYYTDVAVPMFCEEAPQGETLAVSWWSEAVERFSERNCELRVYND